MTVAPHVSVPATEHLLLVARHQVLLPQRRSVLVHRVHPLAALVAVAAPVAGLADRLLGERGARGGDGLVEALLLRLLGELHEVGALVAHHGAHPLLLGVHLALHVGHQFARLFAKRSN